jgi:hypothetical protein
VLRRYCGAHGKIKGMSQAICSFSDLELASQKTRRVDNSKVKLYHYRPGVVQRVGRDIALLFHDRGIRRG